MKSLKDISSEQLNEAKNIDVYFAEGKYKDGDDFHTSDEDLETLKDDVADMGKELDKKSIKYYIRYDNGKEELLKESLNESELKFSDVKKGDVFIQMGTCSKRWKN